MQSIGLKASSDYLMGLHRFRQRAIMDEGDTVGDDRKSSKLLNANDAQFKVAAYA